MADATSLMAQRLRGDVAPSAPLPPQMPGGMSAYRQAMQQYPVMGSVPGLTFAYSPNGGPGFMETWPPGEQGGPGHMRPKSIPLNVPGVEVYSDKTRPIDVLGDVVSHLMVNSDPTVKSYYQQFQNSLTPQQQARMRNDYAYAQQHEGETRPLDEYLSATRIPAYFRGYAFQQWPKDFTDSVYTSGQRQMFDQMMQYLRSQPKAAQ